MSNQEEENLRLSASNSIEFDGDSSESNNEVDNVKVDDGFELRDPEASHFTPNSLNMLKALHIMAVVGEIMYESHDLEAQFQLQLMSSTKAANKIEKLKKKLKDTDIELRIVCSLIENLKKELIESSNAVSLWDSKIISLGNEVVDLKRQISQLRSDLTIAKTTISEAETRHHSEIKVARVAVVEE
ncbi:hypothetical protein F0562_012807 [Nyssa sinensis]|uniref:Uncharacterized protein n=1 Tax=Nyssa sinensis TaxID=561372 RepID=A0A5J4ZV17_9ASTE|nr:hypothetical protein F0562_012807 [Nyssa sinensis]